ncbi:hypothetical protein Q4S45_19900 [Massilia sp. R2A-15]|uniref:hypothetical protein n=1 Tax=Massilia sp. R2A-15 TaxID=3064278 RepID=UPI002733B8A3|nr:hypothetical protein [Massilia sp. R2A-15]WLI88942.1 hypothetical protein Q4S45_19900 [Massilia sp. R2A-15]
MTLFPIRRTFAAAVLASACAAALATPVMEMRAEDLVPMASEFRQELKLNANQQTLWLQVEGRSKAILREREARRERLQAALKAGLGVPKAELRELNAALEAEAAASAQEDRQLRELWLGVNDALDDGQRQQVAAMAAEQLMRVPDSEQRHAAPRAGEEGRGKGRGMGGGKRGAGMGLPGA